VLKPDVELSPAKIVNHRELTRNSTPITVATLQKTGGTNDCENVVRQLYPEVDNALIWLQSQSDSIAMLTGTGACIFVPCPKKHIAEEIFAKRPKKLSGFIAKGVNYSPTCV
jgi:4-diphosphocytidyl-2-C-methyl-D-erythritol kinase